MLRALLNIVGTREDLWGSWEWKTGGSRLLTTRGLKVSTASQTAQWEQTAHAVSWWSFIKSQSWLVWEGRFDVGLSYWSWSGELVPSRKDEKPLLLHVKELSLKWCFLTVEGYGNRGRRQQGKAWEVAFAREGKGLLWFGVLKVNLIFFKGCSFTESRVEECESPFWELSPCAFSVLLASPSFSLFRKLLGIKINSLQSVCCLCIVFVH